MAHNVADQFVATLAAAGVKRIYGIVGDSLNGLTDALRKRKAIDWIHVRHEEAAAFAAPSVRPGLMTMIGLVSATSRAAEKFARQPGDEWQRFANLRAGVADVPWTKE